MPRALGRSRSDVTVVPRTPIQTCLTSPKRRRSSTIRRTRSTGIAKPIVFAPPTIAVLIPISSPRTLQSAPPEFPGLIAASVWMKSV